MAHVYVCIHKMILCIYTRWRLNKPHNLINTTFGARQQLLSPLCVASVVLVVVVAFTLARTSTTSAPLPRPAHEKTLYNINFRLRLVRKNVLYIYNIKSTHTSAKTFPCHSTWLGVRNTRLCMGCERCSLWCCCLDYIHESVKKALRTYYY